MGMFAAALVLLGMAIIGGYFLYEFLTAVGEDLSVPVKVGILVLVAGFILFFFALIRSRMKSSLGEVDYGDSDRGMGEIRSRRDRDEDLLK